MNVGRIELFFILSVIRLEVCIIKTLKAILVTKVITCFCVALSRSEDKGVFYGRGWYRMTRG